MRTLALFIFSLWCISTQAVFASESELFDSIPQDNQYSPEVEKARLQRAHEIARRAAARENKKPKSKVSADKPKNNQSDNFKPVSARIVKETARKIKREIATVLRAQKQQATPINLQKSTVLDDSMLSH